MGIVSSSSVSVMLKNGVCGLSPPSATCPSLISRSRASSGPSVTRRLYCWLSPNSASLVNSVLSVKISSGLSDESIHVMYTSWVCSCIRLLVSVVLEFHMRPTSPTSSSDSNASLTAKSISDVAISLLSSLTSLESSLSWDIWLRMLLGVLSENIEMSLSWMHSA